MKRVVGIDLAGVEKRPTGVCLLHSNLKAEVFTLHSTREILQAVKDFKPEAVGVDAPLNLPSRGNLRPCDRTLIGRGIRVLPPTLGGMRKLTLRAVKLKRKLEAQGFKTVECFPGAVRKILKLPGKEKPWQEVLKALERLNLEFKVKETLTIHEVDAILVALTVSLHLEGLAETIGEPETGEIVVPRPEALKRLKTYPKRRK